MYYLILCCYLLLNLLLIRQMNGWLFRCHPVFRKRWFRSTFFLLMFLPAFTLLMVSFLPESGLRVWLRYIGSCWIGVVFYCYLALLIAQIVLRIIRLTRKKSQNCFGTSMKYYRVIGGCMLLFVGSISTYGILHAGSLNIKDYSITLDKSAGSLRNVRIGLISDLHLNDRTTPEEIRNLVKQINKQNLDLICIAGDIFDSDFDAIQNPKDLGEAFSQLQATYGVYACYGNHDVTDDLRDSRMNELLENAGIILLEDEVKLIDRSFYLIGRLDADKTGTSGLEAKSIDEFAKTLDTKKPILVLEHQPGQLKAEAAAGVDLSLSGHTHGGQIFPLNLLFSLYWDNPYGYQKIDTLHSVVTSGIGTCGPAMRVGTDREIAVIDLKFAN